MRHTTQHSIHKTDNVIENSVLQALAIVAMAHGRSVADELNYAVSSYVRNELPSTLGKDGMSLLLSEMPEGSDLENLITTSQEKLV